MNEILTQMKDLILSQKEVAIISHINPDGDTLGSQLALAYAVNQFGIQSILLNCDVVSSKYTFLEKTKEIEIFTPECDLPSVVIFVDCATLERAGFDQYADLLQGKTIINIDHHTSNSGFGQLNYVHKSAAANCQVVYDLIVALGAKLTADLATALYLGLSTDTGSFLFDSVSAETHRLAATLIEAEANADLIRLHVYESSSLARFTLQKHIYNQTTLSHDGKIAWCVLGHDLLSSMIVDSGDIDGLINSIKDIEGVEIAILFRGISKEQVKVSFRSKGWANVDQLAAHFKGGGHVRAAGCTINGQMDEIVTQVLTATHSQLMERG